MPDFDDTFLFDCAKFERKKWKSYNFDYKPNRISVLTIKNIRNTGHYYNGKTSCVNVTPIKEFLHKNHVKPKRHSYSGYAGIQYIKYCDSGTSSPCPATGSSGHKGSLRGTKLARRARSFKDDFLEKISQIRTPTNTMTRSHSPNSPRGRTSKGHIGDDLTKPTHDLNYHVRQVKNALTHFKDVILKNKLEMLSGNGTVVLESITNVHTALQSYALNEHSSSIISATTQVYLSLGKLLKLCDKVLLTDDVEEGAALGIANVKEIVELVDDAVHNLVKLANEKLSERDSMLPAASSNTLQRPAIDVAGQRTSLPDIPLTPRERDILEQTSIKTVRASHSTESILRDSSPPPKPPLPNRTTDPPPLPPKRKSQHSKNHSFHETSDCGSDSTYLACGSDIMSLRSRSPEDNSSLLSASAGSLDSALNHSREEEELRVITNDNHDKHSDKDASINHGNSIQIWDETDNVKMLAIAGTLHDNICNNRNSNESGFESMHSLRSSVQSFQASKQQTSSYSIQQKSSSSTISNSVHKSESIIDNISETISQQKTSKMYSSSSMFSNQMKQTELVHSDALRHNDLTLEMGQLQAQKSFEMYKTCDKMMSNQTISSKTSLSTISQCGSIEANDEVFGYATNDLDKPPALPVKTRTRSIRRERHLSQYDNVDEVDGERISQDQFSQCSIHSTQMAFLQKHQINYGIPSKTVSCIEPRAMNHFNSEEPPPLPIKKKHIMAYMEIFGNATQNNAEFLRHSVHTYNMSHSDHVSSQSISHSQTMSLSPSRVLLMAHSPPPSPNISVKPPALPPKRQRINSKTPSIISTPPPSPKVFQEQSSSTSPSPSPSSASMQNNNNIHSNNQTDIITKIKVSPVPDDDLTTHNHNNSINSSNSNSKLVRNHVNKNNNNNNNNNNSNNLNNNIHDDNYEHLCDATTSTDNNLVNSTATIPTNCNDNSNKDDEVEVVLRRNSARDKNGMSNSEQSSLNLMDELDISKYLVFKKENEDGPDVKGGHPDALIIHATKVQKISDAYGEAFITTFRTFISPTQLIEKLTHRYSLFTCQVIDAKQKAAKESFSLLVRVVNDLTAPDLSEYLLQVLMDFVYQLVCNGQLTMAKLVRVKMLEKVELFKLKPISCLLPSLAVITNPPSLLDLKSADIAEQMTLLDAELFHKIEIPEVLIWAQEQNEERSPNLTLFTEHFNKMSYWARSQILKQEDAKDREKHVMKFIKIMKHLRKINNYNSYLALLSALDSAPIRRLEWVKTITEGLKEYCALIDSSSSFRAYRQALAETNPPCIPYIGLVLQDLTFVHIGNSDLLQDGSINFSKRWQQYNIVVNMKRFKKGSYPYKKNERIIGFFDNFQYNLDEDAMWQISESIKPRGGRKANVN